MRSAVSSGTAKFAVEASNGALTITTTARRNPEAVAKDETGNCLKWPFIEVLKLLIQKNLDKWVSTAPSARAGAVRLRWSSELGPVFEPQCQPRPQYPWRPACCHSGKKAGTRKDL